MPKLDLSRIAKIKNSGGEIVALKGSTFSWVKPSGIVVPLDFYSLFDRTDAITSTGYNDGSGLEVGVRFSTNTYGGITELHYFSDPTDADTTDLREGHLWDASGTLLGSATFGLGRNGWQTATLAAPIPCLPGEEYTVSYLTAGYYSASAGFFNAPVTGPGGVIAAPINAGRYAVAEVPTYPTASYGNANYWADVTLRPASAAGIVQSANVLNTSDNLVSYTSSSVFSVVGGSDHALVAVVALAQDTSTPDANSATVKSNGVLMSQALVQPYTSGASLPFVGIYYLTNPGTGDTTITVDLPAEWRGCTITLLELSNIDAANIIGSSDSLIAQDTNPEVPLVPQAPGSVIICGIATRTGGGTPFTPEAGVTEIFDSNTGVTSYNDISSWVGYRMSENHTDSVNTGATPSALSYVTQVAVEFRSAI